MDILIDKYIMSLYQEMEDEVIADIARRIKKTSRYTETAELMAKSMHEQGYSPAKIRAEVMKRLRADKAFEKAVAENTKALKQEIQDIINETLKAAEEAGEMLIEEAGNMAWNNDLSMWQQHGVDLKKPNSMSQLINAARLQTMGALRNLTKTMGFKNTNLGTVGVQNAYQRELDLALLKIATGVFSFDAAVEECVKRLAKSGLRSIDYASGRSYQIDTAVRMCARTGMSQLAGKVMEANLQNSGQDLVITSQHMGSRPEHAPWQNKVFSYSGKHKKYPDFFKETGYGTVEGLKGANCTHDFYPFWEGIDEIPEDIKEPDPVKFDGKEYTYYQATQKQRQMERDIRALKREIEAQNSLGGSTDVLKSQLKGKMAEYVRFSDKAKLKVRDNRLRVEKGASDIKKTKAYKMNVSAVNTGAAGALNKKNDPYGRKREKHAVAYYEEIRNRKSSYIVNRIAKNGDISKKRAKDIYEHVFVNEHLFKDGTVRRFDADYDMAESFRRILEGKNIKPHDLVMLKHENLELNLMKKYNMVYEDAHTMTDTKYNYKQALDEFLREVSG